MNLIKISLTLFVLLLATKAEALTYWASPGGSGSCAANRSTTDPNHASSSSYLNVIAGVNCMVGGDTLMLKSGIYPTGQEAAFHDGGANIPNGSPGAYTIIRGSTGNRDDVRFAYGTYCMYLGARPYSYIEFAHFTCDGSLGGGTSQFPSQVISIGWTWVGDGTVCGTSDSDGQAIFGCSHHMRYRNFKIECGRSPQQWGATINQPFWSSLVGFSGGGQFLEVLGSEIAHCNYGVYNGGADQLWQGNWIHDNYGYAVHQYPGRTTAPPGTTGRNQYVGNLFSYNSHYTFRAANGGVWPGFDPDGHCSTQDVIIHGGSPDTKLYNNVFVGTGKAHAGFGGGIAPQAQCIPPGGGSDAATIYASPLVVHYASNALVYNNTFTDALGPAIIINPGSSNTQVRNSISFNNTGGFINDQGGTYSATNNFTAGNPLFVNAAGFNFQLTSGSPAINLGSNLGAPFNVDANGVARPQGSAWDSGACEWFSGAAACPNLQITPPGPPPASIAISTPTALPTFIASTPTLTVGGTAACPASSVAKVTWTNSRGGSGTATGTLTWTAANIPLVEHRVQDLAFITTCADATTAQASLKVRGNGVSQAVLMLPFDENTGTTATDISGRNNNGTFAGSGTTWIPGKYGSALNFNGSGSLNIADTDNLDLSVMTVSMWVNAAGLTATPRALLVKNYRYMMYASLGTLCLGGSPIAGLSYITNGLACQPNAPLPVGTWTHLAFTYDGSSVRLYRNGDGAQVAMAAYSELADETTGNLQIGASQFGENFSGGVDEVSVYNTALPLNNGTGDLCADSIASITRLMNCPLQAAPPPTGLTVKYGALTIQKGSDATVTFGAQQ